MGLYEVVLSLHILSAVLLIVFGAWLIQIAPAEDHIGWGDGWILTGLISLVVVEADGPVRAETRRRLADRPVWMAAHATTAVIASVVFVMVGKPSTADAIAIALVGALVGLVSAIPFTEPAAVAA